MPSIFISFRKVDNRWMRDRVYQALAETFGPDEVFKSGESIPAGGDFAEILRRQAAECKLMLVLIGTAWTDARDSDGTRLLDRHDDWVRIEIATALAAGNRVIPVLIGDAAMLPAPVALPDDIAELAQLQFLRVPETHLEEGLRRFLAAISTLLPDLPTSRPRKDTAPADPATTTPPTTSTVTQHTGGGNAIAVHGTAKNSRIAGGNIQETKIHTGGLIATTTIFLTSKIGIAAAAAAIVIGTAATIATTTNHHDTNTNNATTTTTTPNPTNQPNKALATSDSVTPRSADTASPSRPFDVAPPGMFGYKLSALMTLPTGWQACPLEAVIGFVATDRVSDCNATAEEFTGADIDVNEISGYKDSASCVDNNGAPDESQTVNVPSAVVSHLRSLVPDAQVSAAYAAAGHAWLYLCFGPLPQLKPYLPGSGCYEKFQLTAESEAYMESTEPLFWRAAQTAQLGSDLYCV